MTARLLAVVCVCACAPRSASAHLRVDPVLDGAILSIGLGWAIGSQFLITANTPLNTITIGDPNDLPIVDRTVAMTQPSAKTLGQWMSDGGVALTFVGAAIATTATFMHDEHAAGWTDLTLFAESVVLNWGAANLAKLVVRRPRPRVYLDRPADLTVDDSLSFYSGHTALAAGLSATAIYLTFERYEDHGWWVLGAGLTLTATVALGRVLERDHFPIDTFTGALVGGGIGLLVPHLHQTSNVRLGLTPTGAIISGQF